MKLPSGRHSQSGFVASALVLGVAAALAVATTILSTRVSNRDQSLDNRTEASTGDFWCGACGGFWGYYSDGKTCNQLAEEKCGTQPCYITGTCDTGCSPAGSQRCTGTYIQTCQSNGTWQTTSQTCGAAPAPPPVTNQPIGAPCNGASECASGVCNYSASYGRVVCLGRPCGNYASGTQWSQSGCTNTCSDGTITKTNCSTGSSCTANAQCTTGFCDQNSGFVCQGVSCGSHTSGSQWSENYCTYTCDNGTTREVSCRERPNGATCTESSQCESGLCNYSSTYSKVVCVPQPNGAVCDQNSDCLSGECNYSATYSRVVCVPKSCDTTGGPRASGTQWKQNTCTFSCTNGVVSQLGCDPVPNGSACTGDSDCVSNYCDKTTDSKNPRCAPKPTPTPKPTPKPAPTPKPCDNRAHGSQWSENYCTYSCNDGTISQVSCQPLPNGRACTQNSECISNYCDAKDRVCAVSFASCGSRPHNSTWTQNYCNYACNDGETIEVSCTPKPNNVACGQNSECESNYCNYSASKGFPVCQPTPTQTTPPSAPKPDEDPEAGKVITRLPLNSSCNAHSECDSGNCSYSASLSKVVCRPAETPESPDPDSSLQPFGARCTAHADCESNSCYGGYCARADEETPVPVAQPTFGDQVNYSDCTRDNQCASGYCHTTALRSYCTSCTETGLFTCSTGKVCQAGVCVADPTNLKTNNEPCSSDYQCQSGYCVNSTVKGYPICQSGPTDSTSLKANFNFCKISSECQSNSCVLFVCLPKINSPEPEEEGEEDQEETQCQVGGFYNYSPPSDCCYGDEYASSGRRVCKDEPENVASSSVVCCIDGSQSSGLTRNECTRRGGSVGACVSPVTGLANGAQCQTNSQCRSNLCYSLTSTYKYCTSCSGSNYSNYACGAGRSCISSGANPVRYTCVNNDEIDEFICPTNRGGSGNYLVSTCNCEDGQVQPGERCTGAVASINLTTGRRLENMVDFERFVQNELSDNPTLTATSTTCPLSAVDCTCAPTQRNTDFTAPNQIITPGESCTEDRVITQAYMGSGRIITNPEYTLRDAPITGERIALMAGDLTLDLLGEFYGYGADLYGDYFNAVSNFDVMDIALDFPLIGPRRVSESIQISWNEEIGPEQDREAAALLNLFGVLEAIPSVNRWYYCDGLSQDQIEDGYCDGISFDRALDFGYTAFVAGGVGADATDIGRLALNAALTRTATRGLLDNQIDELIIPLGDNYADNLAGDIFINPGVGYADNVAGAGFSYNKSGIGDNIANAADSNYAWFDEVGNPCFRPGVLGAIDDRSEDGQVLGLSQDRSQGQVLGCTQVAIQEKIDAALEFGDVTPSRLDSLQQQIDEMIAAGVDPDRITIANSFAIDPDFDYQSLIPPKLDSPVAAQIRTAQTPTELKEIVAAAGGLNNLNAQELALIYFGTGCKHQLAECINMNNILFNYGDTPEILGTEYFRTGAAFVFEAPSGTRAIFRQPVIDPIQF